jgi:hypothetical protein
LDAGGFSSGPEELGAPAAPVEEEAAVPKKAGGFGGFFSKALSRVSLLPSKPKPPPVPVPEQDHLQVTANASFWKGVEKAGAAKWRARARPRAAWYVGRARRAAARTKVSLSLTGSDSQVTELPLE